MSLSKADKIAAMCYRKGNDAIEKNNWDMAVEMFGNCVKVKPDMLNYRQLLRKSTQKKYKDNGKGAGAFGKTKLISIRGRIKKAKAKEEWEEVSQACEEGLLLNPWDPALNVELGEASIQLERGEIARFAYLEACKAAPKDKAIHVAFANLLEERGEYSEAVQLWTQIMKIDPKDMEARRKITDIQARETTHRGGYEDSEDTQGVRVTPAAGRAGDSMAPGEDRENDLKHAIRREPESVENYLNLAKFYRDGRMYDKALGTMKQALEVSGGDPNVREQMEDIELLLMKQNIDMAKEKANQTEDPEARKQVAAMSKELRQRKIEVFSTREQRYPSNMNLKLELGNLFMEVQEWAKAIPLLQKAGTDPRLTTRAKVSLGKCFVYDSKAALAKVQFEQAVPNLNYDSQPQTYLECMYLLGRVSEETNDKESAIKAYGEVIAKDYDYKDARDRFEKLQS